MITRVENKRSALFLEWAESIALKLDAKRVFNSPPQRGEIWTCDFGRNVGCEIERVRPCIIVSYDSFNTRSELVSVIPITNSSFERETQFEISPAITLGCPELRGIAKAEQIATKSKSRIGHKIGTLSTEGQRLLSNALRQHLDLAD